MAFFKLFGKAQDIAKKVGDNVGKVKDAIQQTASQYNNRQDEAVSGESQGKYSFNSKRVYFQPNIPKKQALKTIANMNLDIDVDDIVMLYDSTVFGGGGEGLIITSEIICGKEMLQDAVYLDLEDIEDISAHKGNLMINDSQFCMLTNIEKEDYDDFVELIDEITDDLLEDDEEEEEGGADETEVEEAGDEETADGDVEEVTDQEMTIPEIREQLEAAAIVQIGQSLLNVKGIKIERNLVDEICDNIKNPKPYQVKVYCSQADPGIEPEVSLDTINIILNYISSAFSIYPGRNYLLRKALFNKVNFYMLLTAYQSRLFHYANLLQENGLPSDICSRFIEPLALTINFLAKSATSSEESMVTTISRHFRETIHKDTAVETLMQNMSACTNVIYKRENSGQELPDMTQLEIYNAYVEFINLTGNTFLGLIKTILFGGEKQDLENISEQIIATPVVNLNDEFRKYLVGKGYKEYGKNGKPSTVFAYLKAVLDVCQAENCGLEDLAGKIDSVVQQYDKGGEKEEAGAKGHNTVINALKAYRDFTKSGNASTPKSETRQIVSHTGAYEWIVPPKYEWVGNINEGLASFNEAGGKYGFLNLSGEVAIPCQFDLARSFNGGLAMVRKNDKAGYVGRDGQMKIGFQYEIAIDFFNNYSRILHTKDGVRYALMIDRSGDPVGFVGKVLGLMGDNGWYFVVKDIDEHPTTFFGNLAEDIKLVKPLVNAHNFCKGVVAAQEVKWGLLKEDGSWLLEPSFDEMKEFQYSEFAPFKKNGKWGLINTQGKVVINPQYEDMQQVRGDKLAVKTGGAWGVITLSNKFVVQPEFDSMFSPTPEGYASVKKKGRFGMIRLK